MHMVLLKNRKIVLVAAVSAATLVLVVLCTCARFFSTSPTLTLGKWVSDDASMWLRADSGSIAVGRSGKPSFAILPHKVNGRRIYDQNDLAKAHPYRVKLRDDGTVILIREASGPSPKFEKTFRLSVRF